VKPNLKKNKMKKILLITALLTLLGFISRAEQADYLSQPNAMPNYPNHRFGAGLMVGEPTGLSLKYWLDDNLAVDGAVGAAFHPDTDLYLHSDILWHNFDLLHVPRGQLPLYLGVGGRVKFVDDGDDRFGIRVPIGVSYLFDNAPVDIFLEVAPILDVTPSVRGDFTASLGARFWF
jgi:hypothetical protein